MTAYVVIVELADSDTYAAQRERLVDWIEKHGGRYLVAGDPSRVVEGGLDIGRVVVIEYDNVDAAKAFENSEEYLELREARASAGAFASVVIAEGV